MAPTELTEATAVTLLAKHIQGDSEMSRHLRKLAADALGVSLLDEYRRAKYRTHLTAVD